MIDAAEIDECDDCIGKSEANVREVGSFPAVFVLGEVLGVPSLHQSEVFIDGEAVTQEFAHLEALWYLVSSLDAIVINALDKGAFVGEAGELVVGLI